MGSQTRAAERRRSPRRPILEAFGVFVVLPTQGAHRLKLHDVSDQGLGFDWEMEGAPALGGSVDVGDEVSVELHFNPRLSLPLRVRVSRIQESAGVRRVGCEVSDPSGKEFKAFQAFVALIDALVETQGFQG